jgi:fibronectin type 3 domain-containing protein
MEISPVTIKDQYELKQKDKFLSPIRGSPDVALKGFKFSHTTNDRERIQVRTSFFNVTVDTLI